MHLYSAQFLMAGTVCLSACDGRAVAPRMPNATAAEAARVAASVNLYTYVASVGQIGLQWNDNASNETGWEVHRSTTGASGTFTLRATTAADVSSYLDTALTQVTQYCYEVRSFRVAGNRKSYDAFSSVSCTTTPPLTAPPTNVRVTPGTGYAEVSWTNSVSQTDSTRLERAAQAGGPWQRVVTFTSASLPNATSYIESYLPLEQPVCYRLIAFNQWGASNPSNVACTVPVAAPSDLVATAIPGKSVTLTWKDNSAYEDGYRVSRSTDGNNWTAIADLPPNTTSYNDASIALDTRYAFLVRGKKDGGFTAVAGPVWIAVPGGPPTSPTNFAASPHGSTAIAVQWEPPITATSFRVERSTDGQASWLVAGTGDFRSFIDYQRVPEQQVCYRVYASNLYGESTPSPARCTIPPLPPSNVSVTPQADGSQLVTWTDNSHVEDGYVVLVSYTPQCPFDYCAPFCDSATCYWRPCDADGCYPMPNGERTYVLSANATSQIIDGSETFALVYATRDGGYSDTAGLAAGSMVGAASMSRSLTRTPSGMRGLPAMRKAPQRPVKRP